MKIALICNGYGSTKRGSERLTEELYNLLKNDYDITVFGMKDTDISIGMNTKQRQEFKIPWRNGKAYLEAYYFGKAWYHSMKQARPNFDLVINNAGFPGSYWCNKIRKNVGVPFITLERGGGREERINHLFKPDKMVYLTKYSMDKSKYKRRAHLPIGIDVAEYQKKRKEPLFMKDLERPIFLSTSALVTFKRIPLIIDAISKLDGGTLIQTSDGMQKENICEYGLKILGDRFHYTGKVDRDVLLGLYQHSDCFVSASEHESFGIVYLESLASGLPIITQYDEHRNEIIGKGGLFVNWRDMSSVSKVLNQFNFDSYNTTEQAKKYDWSILKPMYIDLINGVV